MSSMAKVLLEIALQRAREHDATMRAIAAAHAAARKGACAEDFRAARHEASEGK